MYYYKLKRSDISITVYSSDGCVNVVCIGLEFGLDVCTEGWDDTLMCKLDVIDKCIYSLGIIEDSIEDTINSVVEEGIGGIAHNY